MPAYVACPCCLHPFRWDRLKGRHEWVCPRCKAKAEVRNELRLEIHPKQSLLLWIVWAAIIAPLVGAAAVFRMLTK